MFLWFKNSSFPSLKHLFPYYKFSQEQKQKLRKGSPTFLEKTEKNVVVGWIWAPPTTQTLELVNVTPHGKRDFENIIKWGTLGWGDYHGLSRCNHMCLSKKKPQRYLATEEKRPYDKSWQKQMEAKSRKKMLVVGFGDGAKECSSRS